MGASISPERVDDDPFSDLALKNANPAGDDPFSDLAFKQEKEKNKGVVSEAVDMGRDVVSGLKHVATHPWELLTTPAHEAVDALFTPVLGEKSSGIGGRGGRASLPQGTVVTKENTPGAITPEQQRQAAREAAVDVPLTLAGASRAAYPLIAASGAVHNPEHPVKGAAEMLAGAGLVHGAIKGTGGVLNAGDVSRGMIEAGTKDLASETASDQAHRKTVMDPSRRPLARVDMKYRAPVEPSPNAEAVTTGESPLRQLGPAGRSTAQWLDVPQESIGEITRRPRTPEAEVTPEPESIAAPSSDPFADLAQPARGETASFPVVDEHGLEPVASANGEFVVRPNVLRRVNRDQPALPSALRLPPEPTPADIASAQPEGVKIVPPSEVPRAPELARGKSTPQGADIDAKGFYISARNEAGDFRKTRFKRVSDDGLVRELNEYRTKMADAGERAQYEYHQDENFHATEDGRTVTSGTRLKGERTTQQAKAFQNIRDFQRIMTEIEGELQSRGHTPDSIYELQQHHEELDAALERDAMNRADSEAEMGDDPFGDLGDLPSKLKEADEKRAIAERAAEHDDLTGTANRRAYNKALPNAEADPNTSVVRFDVNGFKKVNDTHGHQAGDQVLASIPEALSKAATDAGIPDRVFRVGGDEFAAIVPKEKAQSFRDLAEQHYGVRDHGKGVKTSISGGIGETDALADADAISRKQAQKGEQGISGRREPNPPPISDLLNVSKLDLDKTAEERVAAQLEKHRELKESNRQTFEEADQNRSEIIKELVAGDGKALSPQIAKKLSGEELLARRDVVRQNDQMITDLSKQVESGRLTQSEHLEAQAMIQKAVEHNDALLSDLVTGSSQKGRDLNLLRRIANKSLDADVWQLQAKRLLGDKPLSDEIATTIRKLAKDATEACA